MSYLLKIALGPVQEFVAAARRTRDLYAGSRLLSELAGAAARFLAQQVGCDNLIFPAPESEPHLEQLVGSGVTNNILVRVPTGLDPSGLAEGATRQAQDHLRGWARQILGKLDGLGQAVALAQVDDLLEVYWAYVPLGEDYAGARELVESLMAARKATRDFRPVSWASHQPKSSLDGSRESVIAGTDPAWRMQHGIRRGEELSGVDLLKRWWPAEGFLSTTHLAALTYCERLRRRGRLHTLVPYLERLADILGDVAREELEHPATMGTPLHQCNPSLLFAGRLGELAEQSGVDGAEKQALQVLQEMYEELGVPYPYYAILLADGDQMGEVIDRESRSGGAAAHRRLSNQLTLEFAGRVGQMVERHQGSLVYCGGDDVLALLPLHTALACARELADAFRRVLEEPGRDPAPTLSVGLAVVHHLEPLGDTLAVARRALKLAKEGLPGTPRGLRRNALCIAVCKRSGAELFVRGRWDEPAPLDLRLRRLMTLLMEDRLPDGVAYELEMLARELDVPGMEGAAVAEARRILGRKRMREADLDQIVASLQYAVNVRRLAEEIIVAREFLPAFEPVCQGADSPEVTPHAC